MEKYFQACKVRLRLDFSILLLGLVYGTTGSPLFLTSPPPSQGLPTDLTNVNRTKLPKVETGWPDTPFAVPIETVDPTDHCILSFLEVGDKRGSSAENHFFLLLILEEIVELKAQPIGSTPKAFDVSRYDVRFKMEPVPQQPMSLDLAFAALEIIYRIVLESEVREFRLLVVCQGVAMGRFTLWFLDSRIAGGYKPSNTTSFDRHRIA